MAAKAKLNKVLKGHTWDVNCVAFSPDSKLLVSGSMEFTIRLWNIPSGDLYAVFEGHTNSVDSVAFSPDGKSIVSGDYDGLVRTWSVETKQKLKTFNGHRDAVRSVVWSSNDVIASGSHDKTVILWDPNSGSVKRTLKGHKGEIRGIAFSQNGNKLASAGFADNTAIIWDVNTGAALLKLAHSNIVWCVCFSHDDQFVLTGCMDNIVRMFNVNTGQEEKRFGGITAVACSFDGSMIASSGDGLLRLWDVASAKQFQRLDGHTNSVWSIAFSRDGKYIASSSKDTTIHLWNAPPSLQKKKQQQEIEKQPQQPKKSKADLDPSQIVDWSVDDVCGYLKQAKIEDNIIEIFRQQRIKGRNFAYFANHGVLQSIGITAIGDRLDIISTINKLPSPAVAKKSKIFEIPRNQLIKGKQLNDGHVYSGTYNGIPVAIKKPKLIADIIEEGTVMSSIAAHPNVIQCYGISRVNDQDIELVVELCGLGNLESYLKKYPQTSTDLRLNLSKQTARGLDHLNKHNIVHRDVAARNVLLREQDGVIVAKVADFVGQSPETRSDVWSFGVLLWEVESLCASPANPNKTVFPPLNKPAQASNAMYEIMKKCWAKDPHQRPSFEALIDLLA